MLWHQKGDFFSVELTSDEVFPDEYVERAEEGTEAHQKPDEQPKTSSSHTHAPSRVRVTSDLKQFSFQHFCTSRTCKFRQPIAGFISDFEFLRKIIFGC